MARVCTTCSHPERAAIDRRLAEGAPNTRIAATYGLKETAVRQHKRDHLAKAVAKAAQTRVETQAENILARLESLIADARRIAEAAVRAEKFAAAQSGIRNMISTLELIARLTGQLNEGSTTQVNVLVNQQAQQRLMLDRLSIDELRTFLALTRKAEGLDDVVDVVARRLTEPADEKNPNENKAF